MPRVTITLPGGSPQPYRFELDHKSVTIGRGNDNDIRVDSSSISTRHAEMIRTHGGYELHDLGSTNGIKLDGRLLTHVGLRDGMLLELGDVVFGFELSPQERAVLDMQNSVALKPIGEEKASLPTPQPSPAPPKVPAARPAPAVIQSSGGGGGLFLVVLALIAFCFGMALRFKNDTGRSWLETVLSRYISREAAAPTGK